MWQPLTRNLDKLSILTEDKGYDWELIRHKIHSEGVKPVIKYREFGYHGVANNVLLDGKTYHQRSNIESTFFALRRKYGKLRRDLGSTGSADSCSSVSPEKSTYRSTPFQKNQLSIQTPSTHELLALIRMGVSVDHRSPDLRVSH